MIKNFLESCDYENGYAQALIDVQNWIDRHSTALKSNKLFNHKGIHNLLSAMYKYRDVFSQEGDETEFTVTKDKEIVLGGE